MKNYCGIDLGGTNIAAGIVDEEYHILAAVSSPTPKGVDGVTLAAAIAKTSAKPPGKKTQPTPPKPKTAASPAMAAACPNRAAAKRLAASHIQRVGRKLQTSALYLFEPKHSFGRWLAYRFPQSQCLSAKPAAKAATAPSPQKPFGAPPTPN